MVPHLNYAADFMENSSFPGAMEGGRPGGRETLLGMEAHALGKLRQENYY